MAENGQRALGAQGVVAAEVAVALMAQDTVQLLTRAAAAAVQAIIRTLESLEEMVALASSLLPTQLHQSRAWGRQIGQLSTLKPRVFL